MKPKVHIQQVFIITTAIIGIGLLWINFNEKVFKTVRHLVSAQFTIMTKGAILNPVAFTGGNYRAKYLPGVDGKPALEEKSRRGKALEAYQAAMGKYIRHRTKLHDWIETNMGHQRTSEAELHEQ